MIFFPKIVPFLDNVEKYCRIGQVTNDNMAHAHSVLDNEGYRHKSRVCNTAFQLQQWMQERVPLLRYTYLACRVNNYTNCRDFRTSDVITIACYITSVTN